MTRKLWYAVPFAMVVALIVGRSAYAFVFGTTSTPRPLTLIADHSTLSVRTGGHVPVGVQVHYRGTAAVTFTASGMPSPMTIRTYSAAQPYGSFDAIDFAVPLQVPVGTYRVAITGTAGSSVAHFDVRVVVTPHRLFTLRLAPPERPSGVPGATHFLITLEGQRYRPGPKVALAIHGLPSGSHAAFSRPVVTSSSSVTMHVTFARTVKAGVYRLMLVGTAGTETEVSYGYLVLILLPPTRGGQPNFTIAGTAQGPLSPGATSPIDLSITNVIAATLNVTSLTVQISGTSRSACATSNYSVQQYSGAYPLQVPANSTRTLAQLGVPPANWPRITMLDLPANQDVCKSTVATLTYTGAGSGQ